MKYLKHNRRNFVKQVSCAGLGVYLGAHHVFASSRTERITILHTNDLHSRVESFPSDSGPHAGKGGMARRAGLINQIREEVENLLLFDSGDIFQGTAYFNFYKGEVELKLMSQMGYDAATLGDHDFELGLEGLEEQLAHADFPFLIANYDFAGTTLENKFAPHKIFERGGIKIGVFGLGVDLAGLINEKLYEGINYLDPVGIAREICQELKDLECDIIICLSHLGFQYDTDQISDVTLARKVNGIDLILGGHTHIYLDEPVTVMSPYGRPVIINQVGWGGTNLGRIDLRFQRINQQLLFKSKSRQIDANSTTN
ncbi:MAG: bifunctional metallophosphatase/5'-nucleotidase [Cyclobacteriaceae bacterium]